jgi:hypothetical protein
MSIARTLFSCRGLAVAATLALGGITGCGPSLPKTYPAKGKVVYKGGKPVTGGAITFQLESDPKVVADSEIQKDGSFTLTTKMYGKAKEGAAEGEHNVMVETGPQTGPDGQLVIRPTVVPKKYQVVPGDNTFTIEVETPRGK